jgi:hypothetical protein
VRRDRRTGLISSLNFDSGFEIERPPNRGRFQAGSEGSKSNGTRGVSASESLQFTGVNALSLFERPLCFLELLNQSRNRLSVRSD